jgi:oligogalacturonide transport system substrate-binding protein
MHRRRLLRAAPGLVASLALPARAAGGPLTLRFSWWGGSDRHKRTLAAIAAFESRHPGVRIKAEYGGYNGYVEKLTTQMVGRTEPDVMQILWTSLSTYSRRGDGFHDLLQQRQALSLDQFSAEDLKLCTVNGKLNGLPPSYTARVFLWNRATFERAGLGLPSSWDDFFAAGPLFKSRLGPRAYPMDGEPVDMLMLAQTWVQQRHGVAFVDPQEPRVAMSPEAVLDWVRVYRRLSASGAVTPLKLRASMGGPEKPVEQQPDWVVGNWAGNFTWDTTLRLRKATLDAHQQLDVGPFLTLPEARNSGLWGRPTMLMAVSKRCAAPEMAARFIDFLLTDAEAARILSVTRGVAAAARAFRVQDSEHLISPLERKAYLQIKAQRDAGRIDLPSPRFEDARMRRFLREIFELVSYDRITDAEAAQRLLDDGNALLARMK